MNHSVVTDRGQKMSTQALTDWANRAAVVFSEILDEAEKAGDGECVECLELKVLLQDLGDIKAGRPTFREQMNGVRVCPNCDTALPEGLNRHPPHAANSLSTTDV